ncbi:MAG TPA: ribonuclease J [Rhodospirillaceae bacterium]|nr:ribonuclease J [Rhodospirillaceae bacterium]
MTKGFYFLPLGGSGEIGMNLNLYACDDRWLLVDLGVSFGDDSTPGVDVFMADPAFIVERRKKLVGIVLTHGHEDHLGAVHHLWSKLGCPVYATSFTAMLLKGKLREAGLESQVPVHVVPLGGRVQLGPFDVEWIRQTHSIPEPNSLAIRTAYGTVVHTGDWKFDPDPLIGKTADLERLQAIGDEGVLAVVGDSTNVFTPGTMGSEAAVGISLQELFGRYQRRIVVGCFATNVARLRSIAVAAAKHGRYVALAGRSLVRIEKIARDSGLLQGIAPFLNEHDAVTLSEDRLVLICTGSQGEPRAALARIAAGTHPQIKLGRGDVTIFSSRIIPGNERSIHALQNRLVQLGVEVVTEKDHFVHVSGHPGRDEMIRLYQLLRPALAVPVHGEARHQQEHARLALSNGVGMALVPRNGDMLRLAPGVPEVQEEVPAGRLAVDGLRLVSMESEIMRCRHRMVHNGSAVVTLVMDRMGKILGDPQVTALGILDSQHEAKEHEAVIEAVREAILELPLAARQNDEVARETARVAVRRHLKLSQGKKPVTDVHLVRV